MQVSVYWSVCPVYWPVCVISSQSTSKNYVIHVKPSVSLMSCCIKHTEGTTNTKLPRLDRFSVNASQKFTFIYQLPIVGLSVE